MKRIFVNVLKYGVSLGILAWLFSRAAADQSFDVLASQPKQWTLLVSAFLVALAAVSITFYRWWRLVRALGLTLSIRDAIRLGFLGYLFTFLAFGVAGGDLLKTVFLARHQRHRWTDAVASVVADRLVGLYALFVVVAVAYACIDLTLAGDASAVEYTALQRSCQLVTVLAIIGTAFLGVCFLPGVTGGGLARVSSRVPKLGRILERIIDTIRTYQRMPGQLLIAIGLSISVHLLLATSIYLIARGLPGNQPSLAMHYVISPIASVAGAVPLPGGMGAFEYTLDFLYRGLAPEDTSASQGFVVGLAFLVIKLSITMIGVFYYLTGRDRMAKLREEVQAAACSETASCVTTGSTEGVGGI